MRSQFTMIKLANVSLYRVPLESKIGVYSAVAYYNEAKKETKGAEKYRKQILKEIKDSIAKQQNINDILIAGDYN